MVDALSLIHPTDKWYIYNFHTPNREQNKRYVTSRGEP